MIFKRLRNWFIFVSQLGFSVFFICSALSAERSGWVAGNAATKFVYCFTIASGGRGEGFDIWLYGSIWGKRNLIIYHFIHEKWNQWKLL